MIRYLAYPRCGSSLQRYYITFLTGLRPRQNAGDIENELGDLVSDYYKGDEEFIKYHHVDEMIPYGYDQKKDKLILGLRNPIENISTYFYSDINLQSHFYPPGIKIDIYNEWFMNEYKNKRYNKKELLNLYLGHPDTREFFKEVYYDKYIKNIRFYEEWEGNKHIIYYDNLKENPKEELTRLKEFLGSDDERLEELLKDLEHHNNRMLEVKKINIHSVNTNGSDTHFWRNTLYPEDVQRITGQAKRDGLDRYFDL
jgi:hypothetical protein